MFILKELNTAGGSGLVYETRSPLSELLLSRSVMNIATGSLNALFMTLYFVDMNKIVTPVNCVFANNNYTDAQSH